MLWLVLAACVLLGVPVLLALLVPDEDPGNAITHEQETPPRRRDQADMQRAGVGLAA